MFGAKPALPEYKVAAIRTAPFILLHYGSFKAGWDGVILLATLYVAVTVPYSVCVGPGAAAAPGSAPPARAPPSICDLCVEILFILGETPAPPCLTKPMPFAPCHPRALTPRSPQTSC